MKLLDGKKLSKKILSKLKKKVEKGRLKLKLAVILVGDNPVSEIYIKEKEKACKKVGIRFELFRFPSDINPSKLKTEIKRIDKNPENNGIVIQLPLSDRFKTEDFLNLISEKKDIDFLSSKNINKFLNHSHIPVYGSKEELLVLPPALPPVVCAVKELLKEYGISIKDKKIVLIGAGRLVGRPLSLWLIKEGVSFEVIDKDTKNISKITKKADIIISGVGKPGFITDKMVKKGVVIIDVGTSVEAGGKSMGDVDFNSVSKKASYITPVPGGVGPMTIACLLKNLVNLNS